MSNPLLDKFEELYGKSKVETEEETKEEPVDKRAEVLKKAEYDFDEILGNHTPFTPSGIGIGISAATPSAQGALSISGANEVSIFDGSDNIVIPTGTVSNGTLAMNGSYITASNVVSHSQISENTFTIPNNTPEEKLFCKVMKDVADRKGIVSSVSAEIDSVYTGFGGQIRYTIEIVGRYP
jgi:hypothetical protein